MSFARFRPAGPARFSLVVHLTPEARRRRLLADARRGLTARKKELSPVWLYDARGCRLFERITRLPEYYPTRREREILRGRAAEIAARSRADTVIELGSGTSEKTRLLLDGLAARGRLARLVAVDVSEASLREGAARLGRRYPGLEIDARVADFERHLGLLPTSGRRLIAFLGGTIGNLKPAARAAFLRALSRRMSDEDTFLLGTDLLKSRRALHAAYNDRAGVTAEFNRNVLRVLNRELCADFRPRAFRHLARFDERRRWVEMLLVPERPQTVEVADLALRLSFRAGEPLRTETSAKFERDELEAELAAAGLALLAWWTDARGDFALSLSSRAS